MSSNSNKLLKFMAIGAFAGAAFSLFNRKTREEIMDCVQKTKVIIEDPKSVTTKLKNKYKIARGQIVEINEDISYIIERINEVRETTPKVINKIKATTESYKSNE